MGPQINESLSYHILIHLAPFHFEKSWKASWLIPSQVSGELNWKLNVQPAEITGVLSWYFKFMIASSVNQRYVFFLIQKIRVALKSTIYSLGA